MHHVNTLFKGVSGTYVGILSSLASGLLKEVKGLEFRSRAGADFALMSFSPHHPPGFLYPHNVPPLTSTHKTTHHNVY